MTKKKVEMEVEKDYMYDTFEPCDYCGSNSHTSNEHYRDIVCNREMTRS